MTSLFPPADRPWIAIDFETADDGRDSACSVALVRVERGEIVATHSTDIRPPRETDQYAHIHGLYYCDLRRSPAFCEAWRGVTESKILDGAAAFVAHWAQFDRSVLHTCSSAFGVAVPRIPFHCSVEMARAAWPDMGSHKLNLMAERLGLELKHHDALSDAFACARVTIAARKILEPEPIAPTAPVGWQIANVTIGIDAHAGKLAIRCKRCGSLETFGGKPLDAWLNETVGKHHGCPA